MSVKRMIKNWLDDDPKMTVVSSVTPMRGRSHRLQDEEVADMLDSASTRDDPTWVQIDAMLKVLEGRWPLRIRRLRKELKWFRKQAGKQGISWGQP